MFDPQGTNFSNRPLLDHVIPTTTLWWLLVYLWNVKKQPHGEREVMEVGVEES